MPNSAVRCVPDGVGHVHDDLARERRAAAAKMPLGKTGALPTTMSTAIVSPIARPIPRMIASMMPILAAGTHDLVDRLPLRRAHRVAGLADALGIERSASSESAAIVGTIMIARMIHAVNGPNPSAAGELGDDRPQEHDAEEAVDDRRDAGEQLDRGPHDRAHARRRDLGEEDRGADRERRAERERAERDEERARRSAGGSRTPRSRPTTSVPVRNFQKPTSVTIGQRLPADEHEDERDREHDAKAHAKKSACSSHSLT